MFELYFRLFLRATVGLDADESQLTSDGAGPCADPAQTSSYISPIVTGQIEAQTGGEILPPFSCLLAVDTCIHMQPFNEIYHTAGLNCTGHRAAAD